MTTVSEIVDFVKAWAPRKYALLTEQGIHPSDWYADVIEPNYAKQGIDLDNDVKFEVDLNLFVPDRDETLQAIVTTTNESSELFTLFCFSSHEAADFLKAWANKT